MDNKSTVNVKARTYDDWAKEVIDKHGTKGGEKLVDALIAEIEKRSVYPI